MLLPWEMHSKAVATMFHDDPTILGLVLMLHPCLGSLNVNPKPMNVQMLPCQYAWLVEGCLLEAKEH